MVRRPKPARRFRIGQVSCYHHHGAWHTYHREGRKQVRRRVGTTAEEAAAAATQLNTRLTFGDPAAPVFQPISIPDLRQRFISHHEEVLGSSLGTVSRYATATKHLENFAVQTGRATRADHVVADDFIRHLRLLRVAPNGHPHSTRRPLRDKGIRFILEVCRSMYGFAPKRRHLPPYTENPFAGLKTKRLRQDDRKPIFVFDEQTELAFFEAADCWSFPIHFTLAKTGLRPGELTHLLVEDLDLDAGWLHVRGKPELGWRIKTGRDRKVPIVPELAAVLKRLVADRQAGLVFLRPRFSMTAPSIGHQSRRGLQQLHSKRLATVEQDLNAQLTRRQEASIARRLWTDAGAIKPDMIRTSMVRITSAIRHPEATCPKSWRHTFATLLQDANVDPLIRQLTLGHSVTDSNSALGMTSVYTHSRSPTIKSEIERAIHMWPSSLNLATQFAQGGARC